MSSGITEKDSQFSVREVPWHKMATILDNSPETSAEAILAAGLDWNVALKQLFIVDGDGGKQIVPDAYATVREDAKHGNVVLGTVGSRYTPLQNSEAFNFFDSLVADGVAEFETAGSLHEGRKVWILAKMKGDIEVGEGDLIKKYVLLSNSHDGTGAVVGKVTPVRVVCQNTLSSALHGATDVKNQFSYRHTSSMTEKMKQAKMTLDSVNKAYDKLSKIWSKMSEIELPPEQKIAFVRKVFPSKEGAKNETRLSGLRVEILQLMEKGAGMDLVSAHNTLFGAYNAVTEHVTHSISQRKNSSIDTHVDNLWFGRLSDVLDTAFDVSMEVMESKGIDLKTL